MSGPTAERTAATRAMPCPAMSNMASFAAGGRYAVKGGAFQGGEAVGHCQFSGLGKCGGCARSGEEVPVDVGVERDALLGCAAEGFGKGDAAPLRMQVGHGAAEGADGGSEGDVRLHVGRG